MLLCPVLDIRLCFIPVLVSARRSPNVPYPLPVFLLTDFHTGFISFCACFAVVFILVFPSVCVSLLLFVYFVGAMLSLGVCLCMSV